MKLVVFPKVQHHIFKAGLWFSLGVILYLSTMKIDAPLPGGLSDKFYHGLCFFMLAFIADYAFPSSGFTARKYMPLFLYGVLIEIIQYFIPYRSFSFADMLADALGLAIYGVSAIVIAVIVSRLIRSKTDTPG